MKKIISYLFVILLFSILVYYGKPYIMNQKKDLKKTDQQIVIDGELKVYFFDVGEADSTLIQYEGNNILIDGGNYLDKDKLCKYLHELNISSFQYVIGTHPHEDHIGGLAQVIKEFEVEHVYMPRITVEYHSYQNIVKELKKNKKEIETPEKGETIQIGDLSLKILSIKNDKTDINNSSIVIRLTYKEQSILFMADAEKEVELELLDEDIESDILRVGHHGSQYATSAQFLKKVNPSIAIISVGKNNEYGHPKEITLKKLDSLSIKTYRTDQDGTILMSSDGIGMEMSTLQTDTNGGDPNRK